MFTGIRITRPDILDFAPPENIFSFLACMDGAEQKSALSALVHCGAWHHISTPADVEAVESHLKNAAFKEQERQAV